MLATGDLAPDFTLSDQDGAQVSLRDYRGQKPVVIFFYPKDNTPICTAESCQFRDQYAEITAAGAEVLGISADGEASHKAFAAKHRLPYRLLSDPARRVAESFGVASGLGLLPGRATFTIDAAGKIVHVTNARFVARAHVSEALVALAGLAAKS